MSAELETQHLKTLKIILQFNKIFIFIILIITLYILIMTKYISYESIYTNENIIEGKITSFNINGNKLSLDISSKEKIKATYYIKSLEEKKTLEKDLCLGCSIKINGELKKINKNTIPNNFNYQKYLYNKKIYWTFNVNSFEFEKENNVIYKIKDYLYKRASSLNNNEYIQIFVLGDKSSFSSEEYAKYQINGTSHLLAISGMHIGILIGFFNKILKYINLKKKTIIISFILFFFAFLTNFSSSILRATLFYIILSLKKIYKLNIHDLKLLLIVAFILIIFNPFIIYDIGFIYSFIITGGIILNKKYITGNYFQQLFKLSIITFLYSLPITIYLNY